MNEVKIIEELGRIAFELRLVTWRLSLSRSRSCSSTSASTAGGAELGVAAGSPDRAWMRAGAKRWRAAIYKASQKPICPSAWCLER
jgi:hypothetical protein